MSSLAAATLHNDGAITAGLGLTPVQSGLGFSFSPVPQGLRVELPWSRRVCASPVDDTVDHGAILAVVDHALGHAVTATGCVVMPSTTIDLRVDWMKPLVAGPVTMDVRVLQRTSRLALASAVVWQASQASPSAIAVGRFMIGVVPGGSALGEVNEIETLVGAPFADHFAAYAGMAGPYDGALRVAGSPHIAGIASVGAFHGGIIAGACERAARLALGDWITPGAHCASIEIEYMRPSFVAEDLMITANIVRGGRRMAVIDVVARQGAAAGPGLTRARLVWIRPTA